MLPIIAKAERTSSGIIGIISEYYHDHFSLGYNPFYGNSRHLPILRCSQYAELGKLGKKATFQVAYGRRILMPAMSSVEAVLVLQSSPR